MDEVGTTGVVGREGRASEMLTATEESPTWMDEATSEATGNGNTLGLNVG